MSQLLRQPDPVTVSLDVVWQGSSGKHDARMSEISTEGCFIDSMVQGRTLGEMVDFKVHLPTGPWVSLQGELINQDYPIGFGLRLRRFRCREIELDGDAVGILDEHLVQSERGHGAFEKAHTAATAPLEHRCAAGHGQRDVVQRTGAALERVGIPVTNGIDEALRVVGIDTHDVHDAVVVLRVIEIGRRLAVVKPYPGEVEPRPRPDLETDDFGVKLA